MAQHGDLWCLRELSMLFLVMYYTSAVTNSYSRLWKADLKSLRLDLWVSSVKRNSGNRFDENYIFIVVVKLWSLRDFWLSARTSLKDSGRSLKLQTNSFVTRPGKRRALCRNKIEESLAVNRFFYRAGLERQRSAHSLRLLARIFIQYSLLTISMAVKIYYTPVHYPDLQRA